VGEDREGNGAEASKACEALSLFWSSRPEFALDCLDGADGGEDVACLCLFSARDGEGRRSRAVFRTGSGAVGRVLDFGTGVRYWDRRWSCFRRCRLFGAFLANTYEVKERGLVS